MAGGITIDIPGLAKLQKRIGALPENIIKETEALMSKVCNEFVNRAQKDAPQDERTLANSITFKKVADLSYEIVSPMPYSAYVEFGTKSRFKAIPGVDSSKFKGKGQGDYYDFLNNILDWVKRKGIASRFSVKTRKKLKHTKSDDERLLQAAEAIAFSIMKHGVYPHPFFYKQMPQAQVDIAKGLRIVYRQALSKP